MKAMVSFSTAGAAATGLRVAFAVVLGVYAVAFAWFVRGFRRYGVAAPVAA